jgi:hypothetical protein
MLSNHLKRLLLGLIACLILTSLPAFSAGKPIRVLIIDGQNNHNWRATTPLMKRALEESGRFTVAVSSNLKPGDAPGQIADTVPFPPDLTHYDVIVSNYNGEPWPAEFQKSFEERVRTGKIGLVIIHAADNAFPEWEEFNRMIGMGWRGPDAGAALEVGDSGRWVIVPKGGLGSGHRYRGPFVVTVRDPRHPVTRGMPMEWLHAADELYDHLRGPIENVHLLATAYSEGTKAHEPMIWTVTYGRGRVFHTPMGHDVDAMRCVGFITTLRRGTEWAATGKVTLPIPADFPTKEKGSVLPAP